MLRGRTVCSWSGRVAPPHHPVSRGEEALASCVEYAKTHCNMRHWWGKLVRNSVALELPILINAQDYLDQGSSSAETKYQAMLSFIKSVCMQSG